MREWKALKMPFCTIYRAMKLSMSKEFLAAIVSVDALFFNGPENV